MRLVFLGPPGVGKGTQAQQVSGRLGIPKISTGDILREAVAGKTPLGAQAKSFMDAGKLVPDEVVIGIIRDRLNDEDSRKGFILDGFPRTRPQAESLDAMLTESRIRIDRVVDFGLSEEELIRRLSGRRSCRGCQAVFHAVFFPPRQADRCDRCGGELFQRSDDRPDTIRKRLEVYRAQTLPLIEYYDRPGLLSRIEASGSPEDVFRKLQAALGI